MRYKKENGPCEHFARSILGEEWLANPLWVLPREPAAIESAFELHVRSCWAEKTLNCVGNDEMFMFLASCPLSILCPTVLILFWNFQSVGLIDVEM